MTGWHQVNDSPNPWRCSNCGEFTRTGWEWWQTPTLSTMQLCDPCVAEIVGEEGPAGPIDEAEERAEAMGLI